MINIDIKSKTYIEDILGLLKIIGFYEHEEKRTESGIIKEYRYDSPLLYEKHYRMVTFTYHNSIEDIYKRTSTEFRLYVNTNKNGAFCESPFQLSTHIEENRKLILEKLIHRFENELTCYNRSKKLDLLCE